MDFSSLKLKEKEYRLTGEEARKYLDEKAARPAPTQPTEPKRWSRGLLTGAFDPFHVAHAKAIDKASSLCDQLIVAVSTNEVIRHYKGEPFQPFQQRLETVSYCKGVTLAIPQDDLYEKLEMCEALGVDVLFSCEEYQRSYYPDPEKMTPKEKTKENSKLDLPIGNIPLTIDNKPTTVSIQEPLKDNNVMKKDDYIRILELLKTPTFYELMTKLPIKKAIIIALRLVYVDNKYFSTESIAEFLGIEPEEVRQTTTEILNLHKQNLNNMIDTATTYLFEEGYSRKLEPDNKY